MTSRFWISSARAVSTILVLLTALAVFAHEPAAKQQTKNAAAANIKAPNFVLIDQENRSFESTQLRGKVVVLNFIFTTCTDVCPLFTANLAQLQRKLSGRLADLFYVSITTDPEIDSAKVLKGYALRHGADLSHWAFLTGSEGQLRPVWKAFGIQVIRKGRGLVQHTSLTTVIDRQGIRRFNHWGEKWKVTDLEKDLLSLLDKKP
jgi:protein SCO1/2